MERFIAYIDEAGDEGFGKLKPTSQGGGQSTWLIIGAMIVQASDDDSVVAWKSGIRDRFPNRKSPDLHWKHLNHDQRVVVSKCLAELPLKGALALSDKKTIPGSSFERTFKRPGYLYNYLTRWLLERIIVWCIHASSPSPATLDIVFSKRSGTNYEKMKNYLRLLAGDGDMYKAPRQTNWSVLNIENIQVEDHSKRAGLQLADCITSAFFTALERNQYGNIEESYAKRLIPNLITTPSGAVGDAGLTVVPGLHRARPDPEQSAFIQTCWNGRAPGP